MGSVSDIIKILVAILGGTICGLAIAFVVFYGMRKLIRGGRRWIGMVKQMTKKFLLIKLSKHGYMAQSRRGLHWMSYRTRSARGLQLMNWRRKRISSKFSTFEDLLDWMWEKREDFLPKKIQHRDERADSIS